MLDYLAAFAGLEEPIVELKAMSLLNVRMLEHLKGGHDADGAPILTFDDQDELNAFGFTICDLNRRIALLQRDFNATLSLREGGSNV